MSITSHYPFHVQEVITGKNIMVPFQKFSKGAKTFLGVHSAEIVFLNRLYLSIFFCRPLKIQQTSCKNVGGYISKPTAKFNCPLQFKTAWKSGTFGKSTICQMNNVGQSDVKITRIWTNARRLYE
jgi:hypothetical protein